MGLGNLMALYEHKVFYKVQFGESTVSTGLALIWAWPMPTQLSPSSMKTQPSMVLEILPQLVLFDTSKNFKYSIRSLNTSIYAHFFNTVQLHTIFFLQKFNLPSITLPISNKFF